MSRPGEITATPMIGRSDMRFMETPSMHSSPIVKRQRKGPLVSKVEQIKDIKKQMPPHIGKLIEGLLDAYTKLLQATHCKESKNRKGARSLLSTCLQSVPDYIELEEHFAEIDKEEEDGKADRDIPDEIYTYLESTFSTGNGWRHFKEMVRAHATSLMCEAFGEGMLGLEVLEAAVHLCGKTSAWEEAEKLLGAYFGNLRPLPTPPNVLHADLFDRTTSVYMHLVRITVSHTGRQGFFYDILSHLIANDLLPLEWLATNCMRPVWHRLIRVFRDGDNRIRQPILRFVEATVWAGVGLPDYSAVEDEDDIVVRQLKPSVRRELRDALNTTFSSVFHILAGRALSSPQDAQWLVSVLDYMTVGLLGRNDIEEDLDLLNTTTDNINTYAQRALWVVTASALVHLQGCRPFPGTIQLDTAELMQTFRRISHQYSCHDTDVSNLLHGLPAFISTMARYAGKFKPDNGFEVLQSIVTNLQALKGVRLPHKLWSLNRLALDASMEFAQSTNDSAHFSYARQVEKSMSLGGRVLLLRSPEKGETPARRGFRLEEGIGEWVACTPFANQKQHQKNIRGGSGSGVEQLPSPESSDVGSPGEGITNSDMTRHSATGIFSNPVTGKRPRASSPRVIIPVKRIRLDSSMQTSIHCFSEQSNPAPDTGLRRSRRVKETAPGDSKTTRLSRRTSLRRLPQKNYAEPDHRVADIDTSRSEDSDSESQPEPEPEPAAFAIKTNLPGRGRRGRPTTSRAFEEKENLSVSLDDVDELGKTPCKAPARTLRRTIVTVRIPARRAASGALARAVGGNGKAHVGRRGSRRVARLKEAFVAEEEGESEDELSFG
jgi:hypothetical protein